MTTWSQAQASKARRLLAGDGLSPEKRAALTSKLEDYTTNPLATVPVPGATGAEAIERSLTELEPMRPAKLPTTAAEIEAGGKRESSQEEIDDEALQRRQNRSILYNDEAANASKLRELDLPPEYTPPTAGLVAKLSPLAWQEPSEERFLADMGPTLSEMDRRDFEQDPDSSYAYKVYRDKAWATALKQAQDMEQPIVRSAFMKGLWQSIKDKDPLNAGGNVMQAGRALDSAVRGAGDALSLGAAGAIDRAIRPEGAAAAEENARANPISNVLGETAGYLSPVGGANAIFGGVKKGVEKALPTLGKGIVGAVTSGAIAAPAIGAVERGFDPNQKALDPDRMVIESLLGGGLGLLGHGLGALPKKATDLIESGPRGQTLEAAERLGVRLGPTGGVNLPPAAEALQAERRAIPLAQRPDSETQMVIDRARPKIAEAGLREQEALQEGMELQTRAYNASPEGQARVPVERTLQAARDRVAALKDATGRPLPGSKSGMSLAEEMEAQIEQFGGDGARTMNAAELDRFLEWVDSQVSFAKKSGARDPLYEDFVRAAREDRQQFGPNEVTDSAIGVAPGKRVTDDAQWPIQEVEPGGVSTKPPTPTEADRYFDVAPKADQMSPAHREAIEAFTFGHDRAVRYVERGLTDDEAFKAFIDSDPIFRNASVTPKDRERFMERMRTAREATPQLKAFFDSTPPTTEIPVIYRGMAMDDDIAQRFLRDPEITMDSTTSTSWDPVIADDFARTMDTKMRMATPGSQPATVMLKLKHKSGRAITDVSAFGGGSGAGDRASRMGSEKEVLLPPGSRFRVTRRYSEPSNDPTEIRYVVEAEEVGQPVSRYIPNPANRATLGSGEDVTGLAAMKAKQELGIRDLDKRLADAGLPRQFQGREPSFTGEPGPVRLDPVQDVPRLNAALKNVYTPGQASQDSRKAIEGFARKYEQLDPANAGLVDELRAMGATQLGEELRNMGRLFGQTTHSGPRYGRMVHAALPWLRALASEGRIPSKTLDFVRGLRSGVTGGRYPMPIPGPDDFAANPFGITAMQGLGLRGGGPAARGRQGVDAAAGSLLGEREPNEADKTLTEEDVVNLAKLIESTRKETSE